MGVFEENLLIVKFLVVISALVALSSAAPQLLYGGYPYAAYPSSLTYTHAVPTTVKKTLTYKTAAFEPVDAATPADAQKIELKETEHSLDYLVPGPVKYVTSHVTAPAVSYAAYPGLLPYAGLPVVAAPAVAEAEAVEEA